MSIRALVLYTCTCSHSLNYVLMGSISCCVLMHLFNILITLIFLIIFKEFVDIELFLVSRKVEESLLRREIGPCLAWCYENKSKLRKFKVDVLYFSLKKIVNLWTVFLDAYQQCFLTQYFAFTFVMNAIMTQTKKLLCTLNLNYMCNKKWVVGLSWGKRKERKTWVMNIKFQLQTTVSNFLVDIGVPVLS